MPRLRNLNAEDSETIRSLIGEAGSRALTDDEVFRLWFLSNPSTDYKLAQLNTDGPDDMYLDLWTGGVYKVLDDGSRGYVTFLNEPVSKFLGVSSGSSKNRGGGVFAKFAPVKSVRLNNPLPPFPKVPRGVVVKFPELLKDWDKWEREVEEWLRSVQDQLS
jgi:hypothetical protein